MTCIKLGVYITHKCDALLVMSIFAWTCVCLSPPGLFSLAGWLAGDRALTPSYASDRQRDARIGKSSGMKRGSRDTLFAL